MFSYCDIFVHFFVFFLFYEKWNGWDAYETWKFQQTQENHGSVAEYALFKNNKWMKSVLSSIYIRYDCFCIVSQTDYGKTIIFRVCFQVDWTFAILNSILKKIENNQQKNIIFSSLINDYIIRFGGSCETTNLLSSKRMIICAQAAYAWNDNHFSHDLSSDNCDLKNNVRRMDIYGNTHNAIACIQFYFSIFRRVF